MLFRDLFAFPSFQAVELTDVIRQVAYLPSMLGDFGEDLFATSSTFTVSVALARTESGLALIPDSPRGTPPVELEKKPGDIRSFTVHRLAKGHTLVADSMTAVLALPDFQAVQEFRVEFAERSALIRRDIEYTHEFMRLGAVMGRVIDASGSVLDDFWESWETPMPAWVEMPLGDPDAPLRDVIRRIVRAGKRLSKGGWIEGRTRYHALCGPTFYEKLTIHPAVKETYLGYSAAADLREEILDRFPFGGIIWHDYRGDDEGRLAIADDEAHLFPVGGNNAFRRIWGPAEFDPWIGQRGKDIYALTIPDRDRGAWMRYEGYNYPLFVCCRPEMLRRVRIAGSGSSVGPGEGGEGGEPDEPDAGGEEEAVT